MWVAEQSLKLLLCGSSFYESEGTLLNKLGDLYVHNKIDPYARDSKQSAVHVAVCMMLCKSNEIPRIFRSLMPEPLQRKIRTD